MIRPNHFGAVVFVDWPALVDHAADLMFLTMSLTVALTLVALRQRHRGGLPPNRWSPGLLASFFTLCGFRSIDDVFAYYAPPPGMISSFDTLCGAALLLVLVGVLKKLPAFVRFTQCVRSREQNHQDILALDRLYREQDRRFEALANREQYIRRKVEELEGLIHQSRWLGERSDFIERLRSQLRTIEVRSHSAVSA